VVAIGQAVRVYRATLRQYVQAVATPRAEREFYGARMDLGRLSVRLHRAERVLLRAIRPALRQREACSRRARGVLEACSRRARGVSEAVRGAGSPFGMTSS
jgi:hypothetical protein